MTKKDYTRFAKMFREIKERKNIDTLTYMTFFDEITQIFREDNINFSPTAFYSAILKDTDNG